MGLRSLCLLAGLLFHLSPVLPAEAPRTQETHIFVSDQAINDTGSLRANVLGKLQVR